jgi:hypothetical protein
LPAPHALTISARAVTPMSTPCVRRNRIPLVSVLTRADRFACTVDPLRRMPLMSPGLYRPQASTGPFEDYE